MTPALRFTCVEQKRYRVAVTSLFAVVVVCVASLLSLERSSDFFSVDGAAKWTMTKDIRGLTWTRNRNHIHCTWSPTLKDEECLSLLSTRLSSQRRLWLFFGDSTMHRLFQYSPNLTEALLTNSMTNCPSCNMTNATRCHNNEFYGLSMKENWTWTPPGPNEGPTSNGKKNPNCLDCSGCMSRFMTCPKEPCFEHMGAYFSVEFARDVELQSQEYDTTQENIVHFLKQWMKTTPSATSSSTTCVLNVAAHDMCIANITDATYFDNIEWFLGLLDPLCGHIVWIHTTAPAAENGIQKTDRIQIWNEGVLELLMTPRWQEKATVVDVFNASKSHPHIGNIHLENDWYIMLGDMFAKLV